MLWSKQRTNEDFTIDRVTIEQLADIIREMGYKAVLEQDVGGVTFISSANRGLKTSIYINQDEGRCFQFRLWLQNNNHVVGLGSLNKFNRNYRSVRAVSEHDGDFIALFLDVELDGGVSPLYIAKRIAAWDLLVGVFSDQMSELLRLSASGG